MSVNRCFIQRFVKRRTVLCWLLFLKQTLWLKKLPRPKGHISPKQKNRICPIYVWPFKTGQLSVPTQYITHMHFPHLSYSIISLNPLGTNIAAYCIRIGEISYHLKCLKNRNKNTLLWSNNTEKVEAKHPSF